MEIECGRRLIDEDGCISYAEIQAQARIGRNKLQKILCENLDLIQRGDRWIPRILFMPEEREPRVNWCQRMLQKFDGGNAPHVCDIVASEEDLLL